MTTLSEKVKSILKKRGRSATLRSFGAQSYDPSTRVVEDLNETEETVLFVKEEDNEERIHSQNRVSGNFSVVIEVPKNIVPSSGNTFDIGNLSYTVESVEPFYSGGTPVAYRLGVS